ncbi:MAG: acyl-ACP--UDP-N-acetylglucosamine O-acyltransferase [Hyphomicrobium sp.]
MADIHPTAVIGERVTLGAGVRVKAGSMIEDDVIIGARTEVGPYSFVGTLTRIGPDNRIGMCAQIGGEPQIIGWTPTDSRVVIGAGNVIREYVSIHRAKDSGGETIVGDGCYLMGSSHVGHDCRVGAEVILANGALLAGHVEVGDNAFISGNCAIHQFVRIGRRAMIRGLTAVGKDVVPFVIVDQSNTVRSLNKVGLRRGGFAREIVRELQQAYRILFRSDRPLFACLEDLESRPMCAEVREMIDFIHASKRGICVAHSTAARRRPEAAEQAVE